MTPATAIITTVNITPVSLLVGRIYLEEMPVILFFITPNARFGLVSNVANRALIVLSSKIRHIGSATLLAK